MLNSIVNVSFIDLHVHTTCSDGTFTPEEVIKKASAEGIKVIAITDHDEIEGYNKARVLANEYGINLISGIECSTDFDNGTCHILGYNIDVNDEGIQKYIKTCQEERVLKIVRIVEKLNKLGFSITLDDVKKFSTDGSIGRPHVARALLEKGYVNSVAEAFDKYIASGKTAYATSKKFLPKEVIAMIKKAGGIPVLAHPYQMKFDDFNETIAEIKRLMKLGIEGIEVVYPEHSEDDNYKLVVFAFENNLYITCGSDFHGENKKNQLGNCFFNVKKISVEGLKKLGKTFL